LLGREIDVNPGFVIGVQELRDVHELLLGHRGLLWLLGFLHT
jgi:hypothetical protein